MMKYLSKIQVILIFICIFLSACQSSTTNKVVNPEEIGKHYGFDTVFVQGGDFLITTYQKIRNKNAPYVFYIEGDGAAFVNRYRISNNPTPRSRVFIGLAAMDSRPNVIYVARPCQYTPMELNPKCEKSYWAGKRLSDDSVASLNEVINKVNNGQKFSLIGYSGGGGIAVLIAARNHMVKDIITVAGNLDLITFTNHHKVTPMTDSLNPIDYAASIKNIPQLHISGGKDEVVPSFIADKYIKASDSVCVKGEIFPNASHKDGWDKVWQQIYTTPLKCER